MNNRAALRLSPLAMVLVMALLPGCAKHEETSEVEWAKSALARNPALEIISTDEVAGIFTVRDTTSGSTYKLHSNELIAGPPPARVTPKPVAQPAPAVEATEAVENPAQPGEAAAPNEIRVTERGAGESLAEGPGYSISRGSSQDSAPPPTLEGPGYSITREDTVAHEESAEAPPIAGGVEKRSDPIVCQGDRLMRIDGETMEFTGDAVIAEDGCDLYISNARIRAGGVGIIARQARVHIVNSTIGGSRGSYEASEGAQIYVARSTVAGVGRRFDTARMNDLGGNEYPLSH